MPPQGGRRASLAALLLAACAGTARAGDTPPAPAGGDRLEAMERRLAEQEARLARQADQLERLQSDLDAARRGEEAKDDPARGGSPGPSAMWPFGGYGGVDPLRDQRVRLGLFFIDGPRHRLELHGRLNLDYRAVVQHDRDDFSNGFTVRRARIELSGYVWTRVSFELSAELGEGEAELFEAYCNVRLVDALEVKVGQMRFPLGLSRQTSSNAFYHPERPIGAGALVQGRDIGVLLHGRLFSKKVRWMLGAYNGFGANVAGNDDDDLDALARLELRPIEGLQLGVGGVFTPSNHDAPGPEDVATVGDEITEFLNYDGDNVRRGRRYRVGADARVRIGPFEAMAELLLDRTDEVLSEDGALEDLWAMAWNVDVAWILTGEEREGLLDPARPLWDDGEWGPGAFEVAARVEQFRVDGDTLRQGFAEGTDRCTSGTLTLGWYPWQGVHLMASYTYARFGDELTPDGADREIDDDHVVIARLAAFF